MNIENTKLFKRNMSDLSWADLYAIQQRISEQLKFYTDEKLYQNESQEHFRERHAKIYNLQDISARINEVTDDRLKHLIEVYCKENA